MTRLFCGEYVVHVKVRLIMAWFSPKFSIMITGLLIKVDHISILVEQNQLQITSRFSVLWVFSTTRTKFQQVFYSWPPCMWQNSSKLSATEKSPRIPIKTLSWIILIVSFIIPSHKATQQLPGAWMLLSTELRLQLIFENITFVIRQWNSRHELIAALLTSLPEQY